MSAGSSIFFFLNFELQADKSLWEGMQKKAEEKKKGYCCVVWSQLPIDREKLLTIEKMTSEGSDKDDDGITCLQISQKTPLRVLHRRSLLNRVRFIYNIETTLLNPHFFLLRLVTSAGILTRDTVGM